MKLSEFKIDSSKMDNADWVEDLPELPGVRVKVRAAENSDWKRLRMRMLNAIPRKTRINGTITPEDNERILAALMLDTSLVDWEGLENEDGSPLPYSREAAAKFLTNPDYVKFRDGVLYAASTVAEQKNDATEDTAKN